MTDPILRAVQTLQSFLRENRLTGAFAFPDGSTQHYQTGKRHREDGPAVILPNGTQLWYQDDELRRDNGPPILAPTGDLFW